MCLSCHERVESGLSASEMGQFRLFSEVFVQVDAIRTESMAIGSIDPYASKISTRRAERFLQFDPHDRAKPTQRSAGERVARNIAPSSEPLCDALARLTGVRVLRRFS